MLAGIATHHGLEGPATESRWGTRFFAPLRTGPGAQTASCKMSIGSLSSGYSSWDMTTIHPLLAPKLKKCRSILILPLWASSIVNYTGLFISPSGNSELECATTKTDTTERSISIGRESLQVFFFVLGALAYFQVPPLGGSREEKWRSQ